MQLHDLYLSQHFDTNTKLIQYEHAVLGQSFLNAAEIYIFLMACSSQEYLKMDCLILKLINLDSSVWLFTNKITKVLSWETEVFRTFCINNTRQTFCSFALSESL